MPRGRSAPPKLTPRGDAHQWAAKTARVYRKAVAGSIVGLQEGIAASLRDCPCAASPEAMIESINSAIREWEEGAFRLHGPRVVSLDRASGKIEVRAAFSEMTAPTQHLEQSTSAETAEGPVPSSTPGLLRI